MGRGAWAAPQARSILFTPYARGRRHAHAEPWACHPAGGRQNELSPARGDRAESPFGSPSPLAGLSTIVIARFTRGSHPAMLLGPSGAAIRSLPPCESRVHPAVKSRSNERARKAFSLSGRDPNQPKAYKLLEKIGGPCGEVVRFKLNVADALEIRWEVKPLLLKDDDSIPICEGSRPVRARRSHWGATLHFQTRQRTFHLA